MVVVVHTGGVVVHTGVVVVHTDVVVVHTGGVVVVQTGVVVVQTVVVVVVHTGGGGGGGGGGRVVVASQDLDKFKFIKSKTFSVFTSKPSSRINAQLFTVIIWFIFNLEKKHSFIGECRDSFSVF